MTGDATAEPTILALNCGSSSLKFSLYVPNGSALELLWEGEAEEIGRENGTLWVKSSDGERYQEPGSFRDHNAAFLCALEKLRTLKRPQPQAVGHRFVHGGASVRQHQLVTSTVVDRLRQAESFAPLHVPAALSVLESAQRNLPGLPHVACLDTAFHQDMPDVSRTFALPLEVRSLGVERFGFHGLSLESILAQLNPVPARLIVAHLGNGSSVTAILNGASMDTTMGLTPTGGVMMGTRCGDLDPGAMIYLLRHAFNSPDELETVFDRRSGLTGISCGTSDVRQLLSVRIEDDKADLALRMFCYQVRKAIGGMAAALGGLDALVFTGGIGEHAAQLRNEICAGLQFLDNFSIRVLPSQEDLQIATITAKLAKIWSGPGPQTK